MKVFISWSGNMSKELAEALRTWIPAVIQQVKPYFTPNDIEKGTRWSTDIAGELNDSKIGIICLTKDNLEKPWVMFEAGALSKQLDSSYVCPILFDIDSSDIKGPLVQFQATPFNKIEVKKLMTTINNLLGENKLESTILTEVFDMWWPKLEEEIKAIIEKYKEDGSPAESIRSEREIIEEILALTRMSVKRTRSNKENQSLNNNTIDNDAFSYLGKQYYDLYTSTEMKEANPNLKSKIEGIKSVIEYICRHGLKNSIHYDETLDLLDKLDENFEK